MSRKLKGAPVTRKSKRLGSVPQSPSSEMYDEEGYESDTLSVDEYLDDKYLSSSSFPKGRVISAVPTQKAAKANARTKVSHVEQADCAKTDAFDEMGGKAEDEDVKKINKKRSAPEGEEKSIQKARRYFEEVIDKHELVIEKI